MLKITENIENLLQHLRYVLSYQKKPDGLFILRQEKRLQNRLKVLFKIQLAWILEQLKKLGLPTEETNSIINKNSIQHDLDVMLKQIPKQKETAETIVGTIKATLPKGANRKIKDLALGKYGISFDITSKTVTRLLQRKLSHELSPYKGTIYATTQARIADIVKTGIDNGSTYKMIAEQIQLQAKEGVFSPARAELIAIRETGVAYGEGGDIVIKDFMRENPERTVNKAWATINDDRVTPECMANQDQGWLNYNEQFLSGDMFAPRAENPRCRCSTSEQIL